MIMWDHLSLFDRPERVKRWLPALGQSTSQVKGRASADKQPAFQPSRGGPAAYASGEASKPPGVCAWGQRVWTE